MSRISLALASGFGSACVLSLALGCSSGAAVGDSGGAAGQAIAASGASAGGISGVSGNNAGPLGGGVTSGGSVTSGGAIGVSGGAASGGNVSGGAGGSTSSGGSAMGGGAGGAGGAAPGVPCSMPFTDDFSGISGCVTDVSGITFKFFPLDKGITPAHVAIFFHGDTAIDWQGFAFPDIVKWAKMRTILVIAPLSPVAYDGDPPDQPSYGAAQIEDAQKVGGAIEDFLKAYGAPHDKLLYWSISGGSWFITSSFLPLMGARLPGVYALSCGASEFWNDYSWDTMSVARQEDKLFFNYGTEDFLKPGEEASAAKFKADGFDVSVKTYQGAQHCDHDIDAPTIAFWEPNL